jgi:hypothetical protein
MQMAPNSMMQPQIILLKEGTDTSQGKGQLISNINACQAVVDIVRTTLGPRGMDKLIHDDNGQVTISNDGATIMKLLQIVHPAANTLVQVFAAPAPRLRTVALPELACAGCQHSCCWPPCGDQGGRGAGGAGGRDVEGGGRAVEESRVMRGAYWREPDDAAAHACWAGHRVSFAARPRAEPTPPLARVTDFDVSGRGGR